MEQAQLRLHEQSLGLLPRPPGPGPLDHFFPPLLPGLQGVPGLQSSMPTLHPSLTSVASSMHGLPGFLAHPHAGYPSYLTPPTSSPLGVNPSSVSVSSATSTQSNFSSTSSLSLSPPIISSSLQENSLSPTPPEEDLRSTSIVALRMKAKEHLQILGKTSALV
ncbi:UNVERIFIED_CONTAM: hypothetical protein RMT77_004741 [Armadillidium vulgare]